MTAKHDFVELRSVESSADHQAGHVALHFDVSVHVAGFAGHGVFVAPQEAVDAFEKQLNSLLHGAVTTAALQCGQIDGNADAAYFGCVVNPSHRDNEFIAQISVGVAGADRLLHRLHVELSVTAAALGGFQRDLNAMLHSHTGTAVLHESRPRPPQLIEG